MSEDITIVNSDGTMGENWTSSLGGELQGNETLSGVQSIQDLVGGYIKSQQPAEFGMEQYKSLFSDEEKSEFGEVLDRFEDPKEVFKSFRETQKMARRKGDIPKPLDQGGTEDEWKAFWAKLGTPEASDGYEFPTIEGLNIDDGYKNSVLGIAHKHNLTKSQAEGIFSDWLNMEKNMQTELSEQANSEWNKRMSRLSDSWGDAKDEMDASVRNLIKHFGYEKDIDAIVSPETMLLLGDIAKQLDERGQVGTIFNQTRAGIETQIQEVEAEIIQVMNENPSDPKVDQLQSRLRDLRERSGGWSK